MSQDINRRDFLKLVTLLSIPLMQGKWPYGIEIDRNSFSYQDSPNILILLFDTLSAKHVSLYGYKRETTPNLARFAQNATIYHSHYTAGNFTSPGTASLFTGMYPWSHRAFHQGGTIDTRYEKMNIFSLVPNHYFKTVYTHNIWVSLLLHQFRGNLDLWKNTQDLCLNDGELYDKIFPNDYSVAYLSETTSLISGRSTPESSSLFLSWLLHRARRIMSMRTLSREYGQLFPRGIPASWTYFFLLEDAINWLIDQMNNFPKPFLGYYHFMPPHAPYTARRDFIDVFKDDWNPIAKKTHFFSQDVPDQLLNQRRREYDEYIAYTDSEFGRLFDFMAQSDLLDNTYVIITSDHGELFERGIRGHTTQTLYEPLIRNPLLISKPGQRGREDVHIPTSSVDLLPTLLRVTGQSTPDWCDGRLLPTFGDQEADHDRAIFAVEAKSNPKHAPLTKATVAIIKDQYKLIHYFGYDKYESEYELYNLVNDPEELEDLYASEKQIANNLQKALKDKLQEVNQPYL